ncbi:hypothetical protein ALC56_13864, partial [Trachymyrmex septentrionalis]
RNRGGEPESCRSVVSPRVPWHAGSSPSIATRRFQLPASISSNAHTFAHGFSDKHCGLFTICRFCFTLLRIISGFFMQLPTSRGGTHIHRWCWFAGETAFHPGIETRAKCIHKQCLLPSRHNTERHSTSRKIDLDPSERLETPVVTASRQARDNEIQYIFSTSTCKDNNIHTERSEIYIHIRRKIYICTNNGRA